MSGSENRLDNKHPVNIDISAWDKAVKRLLSSLEKGEGEILSFEGPYLYEDHNIVLVAGPTGSGKTALLNTLLGERLLPEGTDHTTPVPTVIIKGNTPKLRCIGPRGGTLRNPPPLLLGGYQVPESSAFKGKSAVEACISAVPDEKGLLERWYRFWEPCFEAARQGRCVCVELSAPFSWLPRNVALVDLPGYEGWYPDSAPELHAMVIHWLNRAVHSVFAMEMTKVFLGGSARFIKRQLEHDRSASLFVTQVDRFDKDGCALERAFEEFKSKVGASLEEQGISLGDKTTLFFGSSKLTGHAKRNIELHNLVLTETTAFMDHLQSVLENAPDMANDYRQKLEHQVHQQLDELEKKLAAGIKQAIAKARTSFMQRKYVSMITAAVDQALKRVEVTGVDILFKRAETKKKYTEAVTSAVKRTLKIAVEDTAVSFQDELTKIVDKQINDFVYNVGVMVDDITGLDATVTAALSDTAKSVQASIAASLAGIVTAVVAATFLWNVTAILGIVIMQTLNPAALVVLVVATLLSIGGIVRGFKVKDRIANKLSAGIKARIDQEFLARVWNEVEPQFEKTFDGLWLGLAPDGNRLTIKGKPFPGLKSIL